MRRAGVMLLVLTGAAVFGGTSLKRLLDPAHKDFPLAPVPWPAWEKLSKEEKLRAKGTDPAAWEVPKPWPETPEEKKRREEREAKQREARAAGKLPQYPGDRAPGFLFDERLKKKQAAFEELVQPASASKLEGLIKQLDLCDKMLARYDRKTADVHDDYAQVAEQMAKAQQTYSDNYQKRFGKLPDTVMLPRSLIQGYNRAARALQRVRALRQAELQFQDWMLFRIGRLIGELSEDEAEKPLRALARGIKDRDWSTRVRCARLLGHVGGAQAAALFEDAMRKEKDPMVLAELVRIRVQRGGDKVMEILKERLDDEHWTVRAAAVRALAEISKKESIDLLIARMEKEDGRLLDDINAALTKLTGKRFQPAPEPWKVWWGKARAAWRPPQKPTEGDTPAEGRKKGVVYFYGIQSRSKRVVFCVDVSGSMSFPLDGRNGKKDPRIDTAKRELYQALAGLPEDAQFSIVAYSSDVRLWKKKMMPATLRNKQAARKFVEKLEPTGSTNIYDALVTSLEVAATVGKTKGEDPEADTIFFMTDGIPTHGKITDPHQILAEITRRNELLGLVIHTVGVSKEQNRAFLSNLAKRNGGRYVGHK